MRIFDLHCDTAQNCTVKDWSMIKNDGQLDIERGIKNELWIQTFACFISNKYKGEEAEKLFYSEHKKIIDTVKQNPDKIELFNVNKAPKPGICNAVISIEGGQALGGKLQNIKTYKELGVKIFGIVWNGDNELASGAHGSGQGLTAFGKECLKELEHYNITVDISHLCDNGIEDVFSLAKKPVIATHSNMRSVNCHTRNLKDEYFKFLVECKGLCGINFYPEFINGGEDCTPDEIRLHIDKMLELGGENIIALGSDFDGASMPSFINDITGLYTLYENVVKWYGIKIADKLFYENAYDFFKRTFTE